MSSAVPASRIRSRLRRRVRPSAATLAKRRVQAALATLLALLLVLVAIGFIGAIVLYRSAENRYVDVALPGLVKGGRGIEGHVVTSLRGGGRSGPSGRSRYA